MSLVAPPPVINSARVVEYAIIEDADPFTGFGTIYVNDKLLGRVPRLALCENLGTDLGPLLFHCDEAWSVLGCRAGRLSKTQSSALNKDTLAFRHDGFP